MTNSFPFTGIQAALWGPYTQEALGSGKSLFLLSLLEDRGRQGAPGAPHPAGSPCSAPEARPSDPTKILESLHGSLAQGQGGAWRANPIGLETQNLKLLRRRKTAYVLPE